MSVAFGASGAAANAALSPVNVPYPASTAAGDLLVLTAVTKFNPNSPTSPSSPWVLQGQVSGGSGADGADVGTVVTSVWTKIADGTETGNLSLVLHASNNVTLARMHRYTKSSSTASWNIAATTGSDNTAGTAWSVTGAANPGIIAADMMLAVSGINTDTYTFSTEAMTATGISAWGTMAERADDLTGTGSDVALVTSEHPVTTGTASAAPVFTMTASGTTTNRPAGSTVILRLREVPNVAPTVALNAPADASSGSDTTPTLEFTGTDTESDAVRYELQVAPTTSFGVDNYYFDASDGGPTDPNGVWLNDALAFDSNTGTSATTTTNGSTSSNYLMGEGTNAPTSGGTITQVRARVRGADSDDDAIVTTLNAAIYTNGLAELLGTPSLITGFAAGYSSYTTLSTPSGGWTWQKVKNLEVKLYRTDTTSIKDVGAHIVEIEVTSAINLDKVSGPPLDFGSIGPDANGSATCTKPANTSPGDLLIIFWENDSASITGSITGWTEVTPHNYNGAAHSFGALYKIADGTEGSTFTVAGINAGTFKETICIRYPGADITTPLNITGHVEDSSTVPSVTTTVDNCLSVVCMTWDNASSNAAAPTGWTRRLNGTGGYNFYIADRVQTTAGATGTADFSATGVAGGVAALHLAITPAQGRYTNYGFADNTAAGYTDPFAQITRNSTLWNETTGGSATMTYASTGVTVTFPGSSTSSTIGQVASTGTVNLTNKYVSVENVTMPNSATAANGELRLEIDASNWVRWVYEGGTLFAQKMVSASRNNITSFTYSSTTHKYMRIREASGTTYWDTSADGKTWTNRGSQANPITVTSLTVKVLGSCYQNETSAGIFKFRNLNMTTDFPSGNQTSYTVPSGDALSVGTYYWRVRAIDPGGSNTYGAWSSTRSFTITSPGAVNSGFFFLMG